MRTTKHTEEPTFLVPAAVVGEVNAYLMKQGYGAVFNQPLVIGASDDLVKDSEPLITHYGTSWRMTAVDKGIVQRFIASRSGETIEKPFRAALVDRGAKRETESHPYQIILVVTPGANTSINTRLTNAGIPNADARFFKVGLSATVAAPITRYVEHLYAAAGFSPVLKQIADAFPRAEIFIGTRDGNGDAVKKVYGDPKYQDPSAATRTFARVWISNHWDKSEVLKTLGLRLVS